MSKLRNLQESYFYDNPCINANATTSPKIPALLQKIKSQCNWCREPQLKIEIERLKKDDVDSKNNSNQNVIEINSKNLEMFALKAEKTSQVNLLKAHEQQHRENEELVRQLNAVIDEMKIKFESMFEDENSKLNLWLKACDGNLNAVSQILFKANERHQILIQQSSDLLYLVVEVDG